MARLYRTPRRLILTWLPMVAVVAAGSASGRAPTRPAVPAAVPHPGRPWPAVTAAPAVVWSQGMAAAPGKAAADTFFLYGGPGSQLGKFQTATLQPSRQSWTGVDLTEVLPHWHVDTFNAANLGVALPYWSGPYTVPATNHAMWDGVAAGTLGYVTAPGYGNGWLDPLDRRFTVTSTAATTTLTWDFAFNHDSEPGYDFFVVQWDSAGSFVQLASFDADNRDTAGLFTAPATFSRTLVVSPGMYSGPATDQVHLRLLFDSDGAWSDEDGLWPTDGAVQVDNIQVSGNNGIGLSQATFEGGANGGWVPAVADFAGDFSKVFPSFQDIDPCVDDHTPQMTFIDDGTPPNNDPEQQSTGGSTSPTWSYGLPGGWVVNYTGGLTNGAVALDNEVWSPAIVWDLPGTADDAATGGAFLRLDVWQHLPLLNAIFWQWHVRSFPDPNTGGWTRWRDHSFVYYSESARYSSRQFQVADLLVQSPTQVQVALAAIDLAGVFFFPGNDATPSPTFDNVGFAKYGASGPTIAAREVDLFQDGFPHSGQHRFAADTAADLVVRVDMARDIRPADAPGSVAGDSLVADVTATIPGTALAGNPTLHWFLAANAAFDPFRTLPADAVSIGPGLWIGTVTGDTARAASGLAVANRFFFDLPDGPAAAPYQTDEPSFFFPGDLLRYYLRAEDTLGNVTLLPADTAQFTLGPVGLPKTSSVCPRSYSTYSSTYETNALPSIWVHYTELKSALAGVPAVTETTVVQPPVLIWNDLGPGPWLDTMEFAFYQNGLWRADAYDVFSTWGPSSGLSNGLGSAGRHGANPAQLAGYSCLLYESGALSRFLISDGSGSAGNDKSSDVGVLTAWFGQAHNRYAAYFGDDIGAGLTGGAITYRSNVMRILFAGTDVRSAIGNQTAPRVAATAAGVSLGFSTQYVAYGGCPDINNFDSINPATGAVKAHEFLTPSGVGGAYTPAASVYYARQDTIAAQAYDRVNMTFPYGFVYLRDVIGGTPPGGGRSARADLVRELLLRFGHGGLVDQNAVPTPPAVASRLVLRQNVPNPFNPATRIDLVAPERGRLTVRVYTVRGQLVTTLLDAAVAGGPVTLQWDGRDAAGRAVASGIYLLEARGFGQTQMRKMALLR